MRGIYSDGTSFQVNTGHEIVWVDSPLVEDEYFLTWPSVPWETWGSQTVYIDGVSHNFTTCGTGPANYLGMSSFVSVRFGRYCSLRSIWGNYPSVVTAMFTSITSLLSVNLYNATTVGANAFFNCYGLKTVNLPKVVSIGEGAFTACEKLTSVNSINFAAVEYISNRAFWNCTHISYVDLPNLLSARGAAFHGCTALVSFNAPKLTTMDDGFGLGYYAHISNLSYVNVPALEEVPANCFVSLPISYINLPAASIIGYSAFGYCRSLKTVELGDCQQIRSNAFQWCTALETIYVRGSFIPELWENALGPGVGVYGSIYVRSSMVEAFKMAPGWSSQSNHIYPIPS